MRFEMRCKMMNSIKRFTFCLSVTLLVICLSSCTPRVSNPDANKVENGTESHQHDKQKEIWTCPMHPQIIKDGPGKCPICGMELIKVDPSEKQKDQSQAHPPEGHSSFTLSNNRIQMIGVKTGFVEKKILFKSKPGRFNRGAARNQVELNPSRSCKLANPKTTDLA